MSLSPKESPMKLRQLFFAVVLGCALPCFGQVQAPSITAQPTNTVVVQGSNAVFRVSLSGALPLACQWRFNGTNIPGAFGTNTAARTYTRTNAQPSIDEGGYDVVVTNASGSVTSSVATLTVLIPPSITVQPTNQTTVVGDYLGAEFDVAVSGTQTLNYQ